MGVRENVIGQKFNRLLVVEDAPDKIYKNGSKDRVEKCICDCGNTCYVKLSKLKSGHTKSCGCYHDEICKQKSTTHGKSNTRLYRIWQCMRSRCKYPSTEFYQRYGGRGIKVCKEWEKSFESFYEWAINNGYEDNLSIDRIDNNGNYEPTNCKWSTNKEQVNNTTHNHYIEYNDKIYTLSQFSEEYNIKYDILKYHLRKGKDINYILSIEPRNNWREISVNNISMSLKEWSNYLNIPYSTLHGRIKYYNMTPEEAILKTIREQNNE